MSGVGKKDGAIEKKELDTKKEKNNEESILCKCCLWQRRS